MLPNLEKIEVRFKEVETELLNPDIHRDTKRFGKISKEHNDLREILETASLYRKTAARLEENREMAHTADDAELADGDAANLGDKNTCACN